jgi:group I intron endonuclease
MNNNNNNILSKIIIPVVTYTNAEKYKYLILKENKNKSGIYRWNNIVTGKSYIGSSVNLAGRLRIYYSEKAMLSILSTRKSIIYSAILKHGYISFSLDILEYCDKNLLIEREQYYLDNLKPDYNILKIANSRLGSKQSEATKIKISISKGKHSHFSGKMHTCESRKLISIGLKSIIRTNTPKVPKLETKLKISLRSKGVPVKIFDLKGNLISKFPSIRSTAEYLDISPKGLMRYLDENKTYNGFIIKSYFKDN